MQHLEFEEQPESIDENQRLRRSLGLGVVPALEKLALAANRKYRFKTDDERRACIALSRLAPLLLAQTPSVEPERWLAHPDHSPEEVLRLLDVIEGKVQPTQGG